MLQQTHQDNFLLFFRLPPSTHLDAMDSIKKKMQSLATETANAMERAAKFEEEITTTNAIADAFEEQIRFVSA